MKNLILCLLTLFASTTLHATETGAIPAGTYTLDKAHASLLFRVSHMGYSNFTAQFSDFDAQLEFNPAKPEASKLTATIDATSLNTDFPWSEKVDFDAQLQNEMWLNTAKYPSITYRSTAIEKTGNNTLLVHGELTLKGITKPVDMRVAFNGGYPGMALDPNARIGFSARGTLQRSAFDIAFGILPPNSNMGVSDTVEFIIEAEFNGPPWAGAVDAVPSNGPSASSF